MAIISSSRASLFRRVFASPWEIESRDETDIPVVSLRERRDRLDNPYGAPLPFIQPDFQCARPDSCPGKCKLSV